MFHCSPADIREIRLRLGKSQAEFARMIGVKAATLQNWEQGRRVPEGPARALPKIAAEKPEGPCGSTECLISAPLSFPPIDRTTAGRSHYHWRLSSKSCLKYCLTREIYPDNIPLL